MKTIEIRPAEEFDLSAVHDITKRAYSIWFSVLGYPPQPVTEDHSLRVERGEVLLACEDDKVLGLIVIERADDFDLIFNVAVDPEYSGNGIGSFLMKEAESQARLAGRYEIRLYTNALMERNISLYKKLGYEEFARLPHQSRPGFTIVHMSRRL